MREKYTLISHVKTHLLEIFCSGEQYFYYYICFSSQVCFDLMAGAFITTLLCQKRWTCRGALCNRQGAEPDADKSKTLSTFQICMPVFEQRVGLHQRIIEEIMQYLLFFLLGSSPVSKAFADKLSHRGIKKTRKQKITKPISSTEAKLAMPFWETMALKVPTRETCCVSNPSLAQKICFFMKVYKDVIRRDINKYWKQRERCQMFVLLSKHNYPRRPFMLTSVRGKHTHMHTKQTVYNPSKPTSAQPSGRRSSLCSFWQTPLEWLLLSKLLVFYFWKVSLEFIIHFFHCEKTCEKFYLYILNR